LRQSGYGAVGGFSMACDRDRAVAAASALPILIMGRSTHRQVRMGHAT